MAPAWRADGALVTLGRVAKDGGRLELRGLDPATGRATTLDSLSARVGAVFATRWDADHAQVLVAARATSAALAGAGETEYWLIRFGGAQTTAAGSDR